MGTRVNITKEKEKLLQEKTDKNSNKDNSCICSYERDGEEVQIPPSYNILIQESNCNQFHLIMKISTYFKTPDFYLQSSKYSRKRICSNLINPTSLAATFTTEKSPFFA